jgi:hypothetical protein
MMLYTLPVECQTLSANFTEYTSICRPKQTISLSLSVSDVDINNSRLLNINEDQELIVPISSEKPIQLLVIGTVNINSTNKDSDSYTLDNIGVIQYNIDGKGTNISYTVTAASPPSEFAAKFGGYRVNEAILTLTPTNGGNPKMISIGNLLKFGLPSPAKSKRIAGITRSNITFVNTDDIAEWMNAEKCYDTSDRTRYFIFANEIFLKNCRTTFELRKCTQKEIPSNINHNRDPLNNWNYITMAMTISLKSKVITIDKFSSIDRVVKGTHYISKSPGSMDTKEYQSVALPLGIGNKIFIPIKSVANILHAPIKEDKQHRCLSIINPITGGELMVDIK